MDPFLLPTRAPARPLAWPLTGPRRSSRSSSALAQDLKLKSGLATASSTRPNTPFVPADSEQHPRTDNGVGPLPRVVPLGPGAGLASRGPALQGWLALDAAAGGDRQPGAAAAATGGAGIGGGFGAAARSRWQAAAEAAAHEGAPGGHPQGAHHGAAEPLGAPRPALSAADEASDCATDDGAGAGPAGVAAAAASGWGGARLRGHRRAPKQPETLARLLSAQGGPERMQATLQAVLDDPDPE
jgi:hypothetical protein